ncbi:unnamed protein product, partial [Vitis vinifera]
MYVGEWFRGKTMGKGKFSWPSGATYEGEFKSGYMDGKGTYTGNNGDTYRGQWVMNLRHGRGIKSYVNGDLYDGEWRRGLQEGHGKYQWKNGNQYIGEWKNGVICDSSVRPRRMSVDGRVSPGAMNMWDDGDCSFDSTDGDSIMGNFDESLLDAGQQNRPPRIVKRQGETISKGHKNYELMLNLQLGIRHSVGRPAPVASLDLKASAFDPKEKVWTRFPPEGSKYTPPHQSSEFKWKDYCPLVFRTLRKLFKVDPADYMISICGNDALRELSSPGKSGSFFYLTNDDRYMIKTMKKSEVKVLLRMLSAYYNHVRAFENTLVTKFYGLHCVKLTGPTQKKVRFIIMGNLFCSEYTIHRRFDLKGSSLGRTTDKAEAEIDETTILKDLDLNFIFRLQKSWFQEFRRQIDRDCEFLEQERIMDYSLLVGLHFLEKSMAGDLIPSGARTPIGDSEPEGAPQLSRVDMDQLLVDPSWWASVKLGQNMPARVEKTVRRNDWEFQQTGEPTGEFFGVVMFFGVIDILQDYDISKKLEHAYKSIQYDPTSISAVDPKQYSKRFRDFIFKIFAEDP